MTEGGVRRFAVTRSGNTGNAASACYAAASGMPVKTARRRPVAATTWRHRARSLLQPIRQRPPLTSPRSGKNGSEWPEIMTMTLSKPSSGATIASRSSMDTIRKYVAILIYGNNPTAMRASNTSSYPGTQLKVQNDGNLIIYSTSNVEVWASNNFCQRYCTLSVNR